MEESLKNRIIIALVILALIFLIGMIKSCSDSGRYKINGSNEMRTRIDCEEKLNNFSKEKAAIENKANAATEALEEERAALAATKKALLQEQLVSQSLKEEIEKITKLKEALEEDLKEALVKVKAEKTKK
jgi:hypothetical protein